MDQAFLMRECVWCVWVCGVCVWVCVCCGMSTPFLIDSKQTSIDMCVHADQHTVQTRLKSTVGSSFMYRNLVVM